MFFPLGSHLFDCRSEFGHDSGLFEGRCQHGGGACAKGFRFLVVRGAIQDGYCAEWNLSRHLCGPVLCFLEDFGSGDQEVVANVLGVDLALRIDWNVTTRQPSSVRAASTALLMFVPGSWMFISGSRMRIATSALTWRSPPEARGGCLVGLS